MNYDVVITKAIRSKRPQIMKVILQYNRMGLKNAKNIVDDPPGTVLENANQAKAEKVKAELESAGATVELRAK